MTFLKVLILLGVTSYCFMQTSAATIPVKDEQKNVAKVDDKKTEEKEIEKRFVAETASAFTTAMVGAAITSGASLASTTVSGLLNTNIRVAVAGSIENFSKYTMIMIEQQYLRGSGHKPMVNIHPGKKEGWSSQKTAHTATGSSVFGIYRVNGIYVNIYYDAPYSFDLHANTLALAITRYPMNAYRMAHSPRSFYLAREKYYKRMKPTEICRLGFCLKGTMGQTHHPVIHIQLYPKSWYDTAPSLRESYSYEKNAAGMYKNYLKAEF